MDQKRLKGPQFQSIPFNNPKDLGQISLDLNKQDQYVTSQGVTLVHSKAIPSTIGQKSRGGYRHSDAVDNISSHGFIYRDSGEFNAMITSLNDSRQAIEGGYAESSTCRLILPRFYNKNGELAAGDRIHLCIGDRIYLKENITEVCAYQKVAFTGNGEDFLQFPPIEVEFIIDSNGIEYKKNIDFELTQQGTIKWIGNSPGVDPETGLGRIYGIRYHYRAHWYIKDIPNEVRVCNVTENGVRKTERMPYHAILVREYVYYNQTNSEIADMSKSKQPVEKPIEIPQTGQAKIKVNINDED
jgi:hypothetical protein